MDRRTERQLAVEKKAGCVVRLRGHDHEPAMCPDSKGNQQHPGLYEKVNCW